MLYISYRGIYEGNDFQDANTPKQIGKALSYGFACMVDAWRVDDKIYLGNDQPITEVSDKYLQGRKFYINARNTDMQNWLATQPASLYPSWFFFPVTPFPPSPVEASNGKLITPGTVPVNNTSVIFLPEIDDTSLLSTVKLKCFGVISNYLTFIRRYRFEGIWY